MTKQLKKYDYSSIADAKKKLSIEFKSKIETFEKNDTEISGIRNYLRDKLYNYVKYEKTQTTKNEDKNKYEKKNLFNLCLEFLGKTNKEIRTTNIRRILDVVSKSVVLLLDADADESIRISIYNGKTETKICNVKSNPTLKKPDLSFRAIKADMMIEYNYFKPSFKVKDKDLQVFVEKDNEDTTPIPMNDTMINKVYSILHSEGRVANTDPDDDDDEGLTNAEIVQQWNDYLTNWLNDEDALADLNADEEFHKQWSIHQTYVNQLNSEMLKVSNADSKPQSFVNPKALKKTG
jgi:hypothetical protein